MTNSNQPPVLTLKDGLVGVKIWLNANENGNYYKAQPFRLYELEQGNWQESDSFSRSELLKLNRLLGRAYDHISEFLERDKQDLK